MAALAIWIYAYSSHVFMVELVWLEDVCAWNITPENSANPHSRPVTVGLLEGFPHISGVYSIHK